MNISAATRSFQWKPLAKDDAGLPVSFPRSLYYASAVLVGDWVCISGRYEIPARATTERLTRVFLVNVSTGQGITLQTEGPHAFGQAAVLYEDAMYCYGGFQQHEFAPSRLSKFDLILQEFEACTVRGESPGNYSYTCSGLLQRSGKWVIFGGSDDRSDLHNELCMLDLQQEKMIWRKPEAKGASPSARYAAGHCMDDLESKMYIYGGAGHDGLLGDMFILHCPERGRPVWSEVATHPMLSHASNSLTMTKVEGKLLIYGGEAGPAVLPMVMFDTRTKEWVEVKAQEEKRKRRDGYTICGKVPRSFAHCAVATQRGVLVIGGVAAEWRFIAPTGE